MAINNINTATFLGDAVIYIRDDLLTNISDPITHSGNSKFVMTSFPRRNVVFPLITVKSRGFNMIQRGGLASTVTINRLGIEIRVWARNVKERDELSQSVLNRLRSIQRIASTGSLAVGLHDFTITSVIDIDELGGEQAIRSKLMQIEYLVILGET